MSVIICGAGVVGLCLAHGLKKANIPFEIYERDTHVDARPHGWAITLHWVLPYLRQLLDAATLDAIDAVQVDPDIGRCDRGNFLFLNLATLEAKFRIPPNDRRRVNRERLRKALLRGVAGHVRWGKRLARVELVADGGGVRAVFEDGDEARGRLLVGAEGASSRTREFLVPDAHANHQLPVKLVGAAVDLTPDQAQPLRDIDPLLFQGCHPETGHFLWVSLLETPDTNGSRATPAEHYRVQVIISWLVKDPAADQVPATDAARLAEMRRRAEGFHPSLRAVIDGIPASSPIMEIALQDWPCRPWDNRDGRVTLVGDAAHAMTMYRGEAANHGILDAFYLCRALERAGHGGQSAQRQAVDEYEAEMTQRAAPAVLLSRQACLDAHDYHGLNENSAVLKRRAVQAE
ncbi:FAD binding domain-containing protein [Hirsutella rhossiliensis]|uniref:FAD binding domain-containing protein n=1 Tax=Hirsutella rhossiliensis TaxID=111463 RepID=A0A9P8N2G9_9HYPO|nr:FAD binding domain-containing protein [Hirsutella rhossiliensis]KAH0964634.1 FAD binding domain-containing protein [Hirsutella rhossiliensis]